MSEALENGSPRGLFVSIEHPSGTGYFYTGIGARVWNGQTWNGVGRFGGITPIKQTSDLAIQDITFGLSGVDPSLLAGLGDAVLNLKGQVWLACFARDDSVIPDPYQIIDSELDYQVFTIDNTGLATIQIIAHSGFYTLQRGVDEAWTPENQKLTYPTDTGLDMIPGLQNQNLQWTPS